LTRPLELPDFPASPPDQELAACPYGLFEQAREQAPVVRSPYRDEYLVFRHEDIFHVLASPELFSETLPEGTPMDRGAETMISHVPAPKHTAMRNLASRPFTPSRLGRYEPRLTRIVDELIDRFAPRGHVELMRELALPLPAILMCELMDLPTSGPEWELVEGQWGGTIGGAEGNNEAYWRVLADYFEEKVAERIDRPGEDLISELVRLQVERDGEADLDYLTVIAAELMVGGAGTTALMIVNTVWLLLRDPEQLAKVRSDLRLIPAALEESLRVESVVQDRERIAKVDTVLGGIEVPAGARLRLVFASGNRDPDAFHAPESFDLTRPRRELKQHFGYGYGIHFCLGAPLARIEGQIALERLFARLDDLALVDGWEPEHLPNHHFRSLRELPLRFAPRS
jgi:cytochrome P450